MHVLVTAPSINWQACFAWRHHVGASSNQACRKLRNHHSRWGRHIRTPLFYVLRIFWITEATACFLVLCRVCWKSSPMFPCSYRKSRLENIRTCIAPRAPLHKGIAIVCAKRSSPSLYFLGIAHYDLWLGLYFLIFSGAVVLICLSKHFSNTSCVLQNRLHCCDCICVHLVGRQRSGYTCTCLKKCFYTTQIFWHP